VLAQAEIVPRNPLIVRSPMDGIIESIAVKPNALVENGDILLRLDDTELQTQLAVTQQTLAISRAQYQQASQSAPGNRDAKASLRVLALEIQKRESEVAYVRSLLERSDIESESAGLVIMPSPDDMIGKPVVTGERLLTIADPNESQLEVWLTVGDDIHLPKGSHIEFFPNVAPDKKFRARLETMDYRASQTETSDLAYRIRAEFEEGEQPPRIGMRGTAKLYGEKVSLGYYLFRRPLATARRWIGY
jgi:multidrug resistance efflux pump